MIHHFVIRRIRHSVIQRDSSSCDLLWFVISSSRKIRQFLFSVYYVWFYDSLLCDLAWLVTLWSSMIRYFVIWKDSSLLIFSLFRFVLDASSAGVICHFVRKSIMVNIGREYRWDHPKLPKFVQLAINLVNNPYFQKLLGNSLVTISFWQCGTSKMAVGLWGRINGQMSI